MAWPDESPFLLRHRHGMVQIWHQQHKSMDPKCLMSDVEADPRLCKMCSSLMPHLGDILKATLKMNLRHNVAVVFFFVFVFLDVES